MSDVIPFDIQSEIMKRLPVKSLIQFRSVSKQWKFFIDSPKFIKNYHVNHTNPQHNLLVKSHLGYVETFTSIVDNNTFPQQKYPLTVPDSIRLFRDRLTLSSVNGLLCFFCFSGGVDSKSQMAIIWNPVVRKSVGIVIPIPKVGYTVVGFGVCPDTSDPKLVKINVDKISSIWEVEVFMLSTRVWKTVYMDAPIESCLGWCQVFMNGVIYFLADDGFDFFDPLRSNLIISFDLKSEKFGKVCLPERLVHTRYIEMNKVNDSLGLLEYYLESSVCGVWTRKDGANELFTKIYTVKVQGIGRVLGFRNNGDVVIEAVDDDPSAESGIEVYEPSSGHFDGIGINGKRSMFTVRSYVETLLLLDESDSIIY